MYVMAAKTLQLVLFDLFSIFLYQKLFKIPNLFFPVGRYVDFTFYLVIDDAVVFIRKAMLKRSCKCFFKGSFGVFL